jgi:hypothetical protein
MKKPWLTASWVGLACGWMATAATPGRLTAGRHAALSAAMRKMRRIRIGIRKQVIDVRLD